MLQSSNIFILSRILSLIKHLSIILCFFKYFLNFVGTTVGLSSKECVYSFVDGIILPCFMVLFGVNRIQLTNKVFSFRGVEFSFGLVLINLIKYLTLLIIVIIFLAIVIKPISDKIMEMKNQQGNDGLKKLDQCLDKLDMLDKDLEKVEKVIEKDHSFHKQIDLGIV